MSFPGWTEETEMIRAAVRRFCEHEIKPHAEQWDAEQHFPKELFKKAGELGFFGIRYPTQYGGSGQDWWATAAWAESLAYAENAGVAMGFLVQSEISTAVINELGTTEQKKEFLEPAIAGHKIGALGISEPGGGSDVAALRCKARSDGGDYVISGQKLWITNGTRADFLTLAVRTGGEGYKGISLVTFPTDVKGYSVGRKLNKIGHRASDTAELFFDECRIPKRYVLGEENKGFYYIMNNFQGERLVAALLAVALADKALTDTIKYGKERTAFGKRLVDMQVWRHKLAEHQTAVEAGRWLTYRALDMINKGKNAVREITMAKLFTCDLVQKVAYDCGQMFGGFGYTTEYPIGRLLGDVRLYTVGGGTAEIMKEILSKDLG